MLVLSRKAGERILIGDSIVVTVVAVRGGAVRVGVEAPPEVAVFRDELLGDRVAAREGGRRPAARG